MKKKVLICGGSSGWGRYLLKHFSKDFNVITNSRKNLKIKNHFKKDMLDFTLETFKKYNPDIVCNNGFDKRNYIHSFESQLNILKKSFEYFKRKGNGTIVNINSYYGIYPDQKDPFYAAAKYGLRGYAESISSEAYKNKIKIINIYPRAISTGINKNRLDKKKLMDPNETAKLVVYLCKTKSFYSSSIVINIFN